MDSGPCATQKAGAFNKSNAKSFLRALKLLAATTDKAEGSKQVLSAVFQSAEKLIEAAGGQSATLQSMGGHRQTHILDETFYGQVPLLHGDYMAKLSVALADPDLLALQGALVDLKDRPDALREEVVAYFAGRSAVWELRAQLCTDLEAMPTEDASRVWPEADSPYVTVARIRVPPQPAWDAERVAAIDQGLAFSPWHGLEAHRPLGSIMRARRMAYPAMARLRSEHAGRTLDEPHRLLPASQ